MSLEGFPGYASLEANSVQSTDDNFRELIAEFERKDKIARSQAKFLESLPWIPLSATAGFPAEPGIYFAVDCDGRVQYVGRSVNVKRRWGRHHKYKELILIGNVHIRYLSVNKEDLVSLEAMYIEMFQPPLNTVYPKK